MNKELMKFRFTMVSVGVACLAMLVALLFFGTVDLPAADVWRALTGRSGSQDEIVGMIVLDLRMPMACCAFLSGMALAVAGLLLQTTFNNPLAGPSILGISTGASLGVAVVLLLLGAELPSEWGITRGRWPEL